MTQADFELSISQPTPPAGLPPVLLALWHDAKGDWEAAHSIAQNHEGVQPFDQLHAYLHRKEGDRSNAGYWYRRAKSTVFEGPLQDEWQHLVDLHLK